MVGLPGGRHYVLDAVNVSPFQGSKTRTLTTARERSQGNALGNGNALGVRVGLRKL